MRYLCKDASVAERITQLAEETKFPLFIDMDNNKVIATPPVFMDFLNGNSADTMMVDHEYLNAMYEGYSEPLNKDIKAQNFIFASMEIYEEFKRLVESNETLAEGFELPDNPFIGTVEEAKADNVKFTGFVMYIDYNALQEIEKAIGVAKALCSSDPHFPKKGEEIVIVGLGGRGPGIGGGLLDKVRQLERDHQWDFPYADSTVFHEEKGNRKSRRSVACGIKGNRYPLPKVPRGTPRGNR